MTNTLEYTVIITKVAIKSSTGHSIVLSSIHYEKKIETVSSPEISAEKMRELCSL